MEQIARHDVCLAAATNQHTLPVIQMFWHGPALSRVERLSMSSFVAQGHDVHLHVYDAPDGVPAGVKLCDANSVIDESQLFRHPKSGSMAQFADWFRYRVLHDQGGIWADTDVVCLRPLHYSQDEIYAWQDPLQINNAVLGLPARHALAKWMAECCENPNKVLPYDDGRSRRRKWRRRWLQGNRRGNVKWGEYGPVGFTSAARYLCYADKALPAWHFYPVHYNDWRTVFDQPRDLAILGESRALHLWNEMLRRQPNLNKNARFTEGSLFEQLCARYLPQ
jgi:Alpha 1,4-glycosyltransferase conserved region/Glycosyltransferase sugar-binding region containing DXD motif